MGNNAAFTTFEATVIACYNKGVLDKELLDALAEPYRGSAIDRGGMTGRLTKDGMDVDQVIFKVYGIPFPPRPDLPKDSREWTEIQEDKIKAWHYLVYEAPLIEEGGVGDEIHPRRRPVPDTVSAA